MLDLTSRFRLILAALWLPLGLVALDVQIAEDTSFEKVVYEGHELFVPESVLMNLDQNKDYYMRLRDQGGPWMGPHVLNAPEPFMQRSLKKEVQQKVAPFLINANHPIKATLDQLFSDAKALLNEKTLKNAGFIDPKPRKFTRLIVTSHPQLPDYIIKTYLDSQQYYKGKPEYEHWIMRIEGAEKIRTLITENGWENYFKVPHKWIYALPHKDKKSKNYLPKNYILVEEDMDLVSEKSNLEKWKSHAITPEILGALYVILDTVGLSDCANPDNLPFSHDGRIAFIDTQSHGEKVPFSNLNDSLSRSNREYWKQLIKNN